MSHLHQPTLPQPVRNPMRKVLLAVLLLVALAVTLDMNHFAAQGDITALRTQPVEEDAASVDAYCGFAPCGMPLECN